jgi:hypothetical protein
MAGVHLFAICVAGENVERSWCVEGEREQWLAYAKLRAQQVAGPDGAQIWEATSDGELPRLIYTTAGTDSSV